MEIDFKLISNIEFEGIDYKDYPDFCDAYISYAEYKGEPMTNEMLEEINCEHSDYVYDMLMDRLY